MRSWVTADQHFGHANIIRMCGRPFRDVKEMDDEMVRVWNENISQDDTVFHLGDFAFGRKRANDLLSGLNGVKHLIKGNHDPKEDIAGWTSVQHYREVYVGDQKSAVLCHYAMEDWHGMLRGNVMLHGHSHGQLRKIKGRLDVGVDSVGFAPLALDQAVLLATPSSSR
jgi:calcineurin-like phosphoesterase family protein